MADQKFDVIDGLQITGDVTIDSTVLVVDTVSDRVGINKSPTAGALDITGRVIADTATFNSLPTQGSEATSLMINSSGVVGVRELGTNAFNSTTYDNYVSWTVSADGGGNQTISSGDTLQISGGTLLTTVASATDTVTINHDNITVTPTTTTDEPTYGGTFTAVKSLTVSAQGHVTGVQTTTVTIPATDNSDIKLSTESISDSSVYYAAFVGAETGAQTGFTRDDIQYNAGTDTLLVPKITSTFTGNMNVPESIIHVNDTDTKFEFPAVNTAKITVGGNERYKANNTGTFITGSLTSGDISATGMTLTEGYFREDHRTLSFTAGLGYLYDVNDGSSATHNATAAYTIAITNIPASDTISFTLRVVNNGTAWSPTWTGSTIEWAEGVVPPPSTGTDIYSFIAIEGTVYGSLSMRNVS